MAEATGTEWLYWSPCWGWLRRDGAMWLRGARRYCRRQWGKAKREEIFDNPQDWLAAFEMLMDIDLGRGAEPEELQVHVPVPADADL